MTLTMRPTGLGHGVYKDSVEYSASQSRSQGRALPYVLSWAALGILMVIGSERVPSALFLRFYGTAALHESGPVHDAIFKLLLPREQTHVGADTGIGVLVKVDRSADIRGKPLP